MQKLNDFIAGQSILPCNKEDMIRMLDAIQEGAVRINEKVIRAGLLNVLGAAGAENVQGEEQQKLDVLSDEILIDCLGRSSMFAAVASEENEDIIVFDQSKTAPYIIAFDPLDGSSNIDVNVSIGTIFSIYKRPSEGEVSREDFFQVGDNQIAAGYVIYGTSTMFLLTTGNGLNAFTLEPDDNSFYLSHEDIRIPDEGKIYSINEGNFRSFPEGVKQYLTYCKSSENDRSAPYSARYIGSMVADIHRNFLKGGIFLYPSTASAPKGKLRLLYECHPMAFLAESAGGKAHSGEQRILDIQVTNLHQRTPIYIGSANMVDKALSFLKQKESV